MHFGVHSVESNRETKTYDGVHKLHADGPKASPWNLQVRLQETLASKPGKSLPVNVDNIELNDPIV